MDCYRILANGLKIEYGLVSAPNNANTNVTFPVAFTTIPSIQVTSRGFDDTDLGRANLGQVIGTKSGFSCDSNYGTTQKTRIYWFAFGY